MSKTSSSGTVLSPSGSQLGSAIALMVGAALSFSCMNACAKAASALLPSTEVAFARASVNALVLIPCMVLGRISFLGTRRKVLASRSLSGTASLILNFAASARLPLSDLGALLKTSVLFTVLLGPILLKERFSTQRLSFVLLGFAGALIVIKPTLHVDPVGGFQALGSAFFGSLSALSIRELRDSEHPCTIVFQFCAYASLILLILFGSSFVWPQGNAWWLLVGTGVAGTVGQIFVTSALQRAPASVVAPFSFAEVLFAAGLGMAFMGEVLSSSTVAGAVIIVVAGVLLGRSSRERRSDRV